MRLLYFLLVKSIGDQRSNSGFSTKKISRVARKLGSLPSVAQCPTRRKGKRNDLCIKLGKNKYSMQKVGLLHAFNPPSFRSFRKSCTLYAFLISVLNPRSNAALRGCFRCNRKSSARWTSWVVNVRLQSGDNDEVANEALVLCDFNLFFSCHFHRNNLLRCSSI